MYIYYNLDFRQYDNLLSDRILSPLNQTTEVTLDR
jgi:hypothetical protein